VLAAIEEPAADQTGCPKQAASEEEQGRGLRGDNSRSTAGAAFRVDGAIDEAIGSGTELELDVRDKRVGGYARKHQIKCAGTLDVRAVRHEGAIRTWVCTTAIGGADDHIDRLASNCAGSCRLQTNYVACCRCSPVVDWASVRGDYSCGLSDVDQCARWRARGEGGRAWCAAEGDEDSADFLTRCCRARLQARQYDVQRPSTGRDRCHGVYRAVPPCATCGKGNRIRARNWG
jgi:hypothetical protein